MKPKTVYLLFCVLGLVLPYLLFVPWLLAHGLNLPLFWREMTANRISSFFAADVVISAVVLFRFNRTERRRAGRYWWLPIVATLTVGVSLGLPLLLYLRECGSEAASGRELKRSAHLGGGLFHWQIPTRSRSSVSCLCS